MLSDLKMSIIMCEKQSQKLTPDWCYWPRGRWPPRSLWSSRGHARGSGSHDSRCADNELPANDISIFEVVAHFLGCSIFVKESDEGPVPSSKLIKFFKSEGEAKFTPKTC